MNNQHHGSIGQANFFDTHQVFFFENQAPSFNFRPENILERKRGVRKDRHDILARKFFADRRGCP